MLPVAGYWINRNFKTSQIQQVAKHGHGHGRRSLKASALASMLARNFTDQRRSLSEQADGKLEEFSIYPCTGLRTCLGSFVDQASGLYTDHCNHHYNRTSSMFLKNPVAGNFACCAINVSNTSLRAIPPASYLDHA